MRWHVNPPGVFVGWPALTAFPCSAAAAPQVMFRTDETKLFFRKNVLQSLIPPVGVGVGPRRGLVGALRGRCPPAAARAARMPALRPRAASSRRALRKARRSAARLAAAASFLLWRPEWPSAYPPSPASTTTRAASTPVMGPRQPPRPRLWCTVGLVSCGEGTRDSVISRLRATPPSTQPCTPGGTPPCRRCGRRRRAPCRPARHPAWPCPRRRLSIFQPRTRRRPRRGRKGPLRVTAPLRAKPSAEGARRARARVRGRLRGARAGVGTGPGRFRRSRLPSCARPLRPQP